MKSLTDDVVLQIASFIDAKDILNVSLTCRRFGSAATAAADDLSLMENAARQLIESSKSHEKAWVQYKKGRTTWIGLYHELLKLRAPPSFGSILGSGINYVNNNKYHIYYSLREQQQQQQLQQAKSHLHRRWLMQSRASNSNTSSCVAIGNHIMSHGVHYVKFTMTRVEKVAFGIVRPLDDDWANKRRLTSTQSFCPLQSWPDINIQSRRKNWGESNVHCLLYNTYPGSCQWTDWETTSELIDDWCGMEPSLEGNVGLLLDLDKGTLSVYKDRRLLGVIKDGLSGEYCWLMSIQGASNSTAVQIKRDYNFWHHERL